MEDGGEATIAELAGTWYESRGYEFRHIDIDHGYVWTKDGGATYSIEEDDLFDVQERVIRRLKGKRILDFSEHDGLWSRACRITCRSRSEKQNRPFGLPLA